MNTKKKYSLKSFNTFAVDSSTDKLIEINTLADLSELQTIIANNFYILGEGSNTLFIDEVAPTIIKINLMGIELEETDTDYYLRVSAGENWHQLVKYSLKRDIYGLENLALIPGSVGAAPVQNIGAYGVEFANFCHSVEWFDFDSEQVKTINNNECQFAYRESIFKHRLKNKGIVVAVTLRISKQWQSKLHYQGLDKLGNQASAQQIFERVITLRQNKLPDPIKLPNAGSFFKNPVINNQTFERLKAKFGEIPNYLEKNGGIKLAAGWLIEQAGLKGFRNKDVGVHEKQALVLVNYTNGSGKELVELAQYVQTVVFNKFSINLCPEVRLVSEQGEINFKEVKTNV